jgi:glycosyltransferase involved in cell wall biosynthesis
VLNPKLVLWHGYLLADTGSNVFTRELTRAVARTGAEVTLLCQDPEAEAIVANSAKVVRPLLPGELPVFVLDRYPDLTPRLIGEFETEELDRYTEANVAALVDVAREPDFILANHAVMGGPVASEAAERTGKPFGVYVHGSELEYAIKDDAYLGDLARRSLDRADVVFVGSRHTGKRLQELLRQGSYASRIEVLPPGVDVKGFAPSRGSKEELAALLSRSSSTGDRTPDEDAAAKLEGVDRFVLYAGKLMHQKGVDLLLSAWDDVHGSFPGLTLVIVGFGDDRDAFEERAVGMPVIFLGGFSHDQLQLLMPLAELVVVPSVLSEAFGMIAAEAAASGVVPLVTDHSGLREVAEGLGEAGLTFDGTAQDLAANMEDFLALPESERERLGALGRDRAVGLWSWEAAATRLLDVVTRESA